MIKGSRKESSSISKQSLEKKIADVFHRLASTNKNLNKSRKSSQELAVQDVRSAKNLVKLNNNYLKQIKSSTGVAQNGLKKKTKVTATQNQNNLQSNKKLPNNNQIKSCQQLHTASKAQKKINEQAESKIISHKSQVFQHHDLKKNSKVRLQSLKSVKSQHKANSISTKGTKYVQKSKEIKPHKLQLYHRKNTKLPSKKFNKNLTHNHSNQVSISIEENPELQNNKIFTNQRQNSTEIIENQFFMQNKSKIIEKMKLVNVVDIKLDAEQPKLEKQKIEKLSSEVQKYQSKCKQLEDELRQTLQTVKVMRCQLNHANVQNVKNNQSVNINSSDYKPEHIKITQNQQQKMQIQQNHSIKTYQPSIPKIQAIKTQQTQHKKYQPVVYKQKIQQKEAETKQKVLYTFSPVIISSSSPRVIRLGKQRSYCTKGCPSICTCLCPSISTPSQQ